MRDKHREKKREIERKKVHNNDVDKHKRKKREKERKRLSNNHRTKLLTVRQSDISRDRKRDVERHTKKKIDQKEKEKKVNICVCIRI